jgi:hypothetical protein
MPNRLLTVLLAAVVLGLLLRKLPDQGLPSVLAAAFSRPTVTTLDAATPSSSATSADTRDTLNDTPSGSRGSKGDMARSLAGLIESDPNRRSKYYAVAGQPTIAGERQDNAVTQKSSTRVREGREVREMQAMFASVGERMSCKLPSLQATVTVLENLMLERVSETMMRHDENATWEVEGLITEYQGRNYLLLQRAVVNSVTVDEQ